MKLKKLLALLLTIVMSIAVLAGCGETAGDEEGQTSETKENKDSKEDKEKSDVTASDEDDEKIDGVVYKQGLPIVDPGDYSFTILTDGNKTTDDFYLMPVLEEQTGIPVEVELYPYEVAKEKYSLALGSGDYADVIGGWILSSADILKYGVEMGTYIPLEELIAEHAPNIEAVLELEGVREKMTAPDGHIYSIPYVLSSPTVDFNPFINTRWLENVGMEMPTNTEEFVEVLRAFKEQDANGNGDPNDEIPFALDPVNKHLGYYAGWFGFPVDDEGFGMRDGELTFGATGEEYKAMVKFFRSMYSEGLIDVEVFTQDQAQWKAKGTGDIYGCVMAYGSGDVMPVEAGVTPDFMPLPVLKSDMTDTPTWFRATYGTYVFKNQVVITDNAENPAAIIRWWDNMFELENSLQTNGGPLGIKLFKEGEEYVIDESNMTDEEKDTYSWGNLYPQSLPRYIPIGFKFKEVNPPFNEKENACNEYDGTLAEHAIPPYWTSEEDAASFAEYETAISDYLAEQTAQWIAGQGDVDADWADYEKRLDKLKLQEYIQMRLDALN